MGPETGSNRAKMLGYSGEIERHFAVSGVGTPDLVAASRETSPTSESGRSFGNAGDVARNDELAGIGGAAPKNRYVNPVGDRSVKDSERRDRVASSDVENARVACGADFETSRALNSLALGGIL